jgi:hypothetical protein
VAYNLGTEHALDQSGTVAISSPIGLLIVLGNLPASLGRRGGFPWDYFGMHARLAYGDANGYCPTVVLEHERTLLLDLPSGMTIVGLSLMPPLTATITELDAPTISGIMGASGLGDFQFGTPSLQRAS